MSIGFFLVFSAYNLRVEKNRANPLVKVAFWFYIVGIQFA